MLQRRDKNHGRIAFVDIASPEYEPAQNADISFEEVRKSLLPLMHRLVSFVCCCPSSMIHRFQSCHPCYACVPRLWVRSTLCFLLARSSRTSKFSRGRLQQPPFLWLCVAVCCGRLLCEFLCLLDSAGVYLMLHACFVACMFCGCYQLLMVAASP